MFLIITFYAIYFCIYPDRSLIRLIKQESQFKKKKKKKWSLESWMFYYKMGIVILFWNGDLYKRAQDYLAPMQE